MKKDTVVVSLCMVLFLIGSIIFLAYTSPLFFLLGLIHFSESSGRALDAMDKANDDPTYAPKLNPHPRYFLTLKGNIAPEILKKVDVWIGSTYFTHNIVCGYGPIQEGFRLQRNRHAEVKLMPDKKGNYLLKVPLDKYKEDRCAWGPDHVEYYLDFKNGYSDNGGAVTGNLASFDIDYPNDKKLRQTGTAKCDKNMVCYFSRERTIPNLSQNHTYNYKFNMKATNINVNKFLDSNSKVNN